MKTADAWIKKLVLFFLSKFFVLEEISDDDNKGKAELKSHVCFDGAAHYCIRVVPELF